MVVGVVGVMVAGVVEKVLMVGGVVIEISGSVLEEVIGMGSESGMDLKNETGLYRLVFTG